MFIYCIYVQYSALVSVSYHTQVKYWSYVYLLYLSIVQCSSIGQLSYLGEILVLCYLLYLSIVQCSSIGQLSYLGEILVLCVFIVSKYSIVLQYRSVSIPRGNIGPMFIYCIKVQYSALVLVSYHTQEKYWSYVYLLYLSIVQCSSIGQLSYLGEILVLCLFIVSKYSIVLQYWSVIIPR